ncbi:8922_t:CDS:2, partial [Rhizophagus irregularis]
SLSAVTEMEEKEVIERGAGIVGGGRTKPEKDMFKQLGSTKGGLWPDELGAEEILLRWEIENETERSLPLRLLDQG